MIEKTIDYSDLYTFWLDNKYINKTECVKDFCSKHGIDYSDSYRRNLSNIISNNSTGINEADKHTAKVLIFDIETAPLLSSIWGVWNQNVGHNLDMLEREWFILTWSAKWLFDDKIYSFKLTGEEALAEDDSRIVKALWEMVNESDVIIAHNAKKFDIKKMNSRFILNGLPKPLPYQVIDTLVHARREFAMTSNKLDYLGKILGVGRKVEHGGFDLWKRAVKGDESALEDMSKYNDGDIELLEELYLALRPYINPHPNFGFHVANNVESCPTCGSEDLTWNLDSGIYRTYVNEYRTCRCNNCQSLSRSRKALTPTYVKDRLLVSLPT